MAKGLFTNNASTFLSAGITDAATSLVVTTGEGDLFASPTGGDWQKVTITDGTNIEILHITARTTDTLTVTRAQEGTVAQAWSSGAIVEHRLTAEDMTTLQTVGTGSDSIQLGSGADASGAESLALGKGADAAGDDSAAIGLNATISLHSDFDLWAATTSYFIGQRVRIAASTSKYWICLTSGTSGASEPTGADNAAHTDGTVIWIQLATLTSSEGDEALAVGDGANTVGAYGTAFGRNAIAEGDSSVAVGDLARATGLRAVAIGYNTDAVGAYAIVIGNGVTVRTPIKHGLGVGNYEPVYGRTVEKATSVGVQSYKMMPFNNAISMCGFDFVDQHGWWYGGAADEGETAAQTTKEVTVYSLPIQAGDEAWQASTLYKHGDCIVPTTPNGYSYVAYIWDSGDYYETDTSSGSEPTWPTTAGDSVPDGSFIEWICVPIDDVQFLLPDYARFTPTSVGVMTRTCTAAATTQPEVSFGIDGDLDKWLVATTLTKMTGDGASEFLEPTNTEYAKQFGGAVTTAGTGVDCQIVFVMKGYVIEISAV